MTELRLENKIIPGVDISGECPLPAMQNTLSFNMKYDVGEDAELFLNFGLRPNAMPSKLQDRYNSELTPRVWKTAVLENDYLKATFLPELGGKLWSLYDKINNRDLLTENPVVKPGNLAICNAWCSGGVEWNIGTRGHHVRTCRTMFMAKAKTFKGTPVLRLYEFSREYGVAYQMEFFLPEDSKFLFVRTRIHNHHCRTIPMYWWSNIAVDDADDLRIVTSATHAFANTYDSERHQALRRLKLPEPEGFDCTYPGNHATARDFFYHIAPQDRKFEAAIYGDGWGLCQCSTDRLKGRKLFVWGRSSGGISWQKRLTSPDGKPYVEIQAGLAHTQMECLPMPPYTAWEWLEAYGAIQTDPEKVHGPWADAGKEVAEKLEAALPRKMMDDLLAETKEAFALQPAEEIIYRASGWGALEKERCGSNGGFAPHLDFDTDDTEPAIWHELIRTGELPDQDMGDPPPSYMLQDDFFELLKKAPANPHRDLHLGLNFFFRNDHERAEQYFCNARARERSYTAAFALAHNALYTGDGERAAAYFSEGFYSNDPTLVKDGLQTMCNTKCYDLAVRCFRELSAEQQANPANQILYAKALLLSGHPEEAETVLLKDGGLELPQLREGEGALSDLYIAIQCAKAEKEGRKLDPAEVEVPAKFDFRMNHRNTELERLGSRYPYKK